jgi:hypothetical protein
MICRFIFARCLAVYLMSLRSPQHSQETHRDGRNEAVRVSAVALPSILADRIWVQINVRL